MELIVTIFRLFIIFTFLPQFGLSLGSKTTLLNLGEDYDLGSNRHFHSVKHVLEGLSERVEG